MYAITVNLLILQSVRQCPFEPFKRSPICIVISVRDKWLDFVNRSPNGQTLHAAIRLKSVPLLLFYLQPLLGSSQVPVTNTFKNTDEETGISIPTMFLLWRIYK